MLLNSINGKSIIICNRAAFLKQDVSLGLLVRFEVHIDYMLRCEEGDNFASKLPTSPNAKNILHQSIPLLNYNKLSGMHSQNQFITPQQQQRNYLNNLLHLKKKKNNIEMANVYSQSIVNKLAERLQDGKFKIDDHVNDAKDLLVGKRLSESEKRLLTNRMKNEQKSRRNRLLYPRDRSKSQLPEEQYPTSILSPQKHKQLMASIRVFKVKKEQIMKKSRQKQVNHLSKTIEEIQQQKEEERLNEIQKKKEKIQQNLKKMRENHQDFIRQEQQSKQIINQIRHKKKLYQHFKESYQQKILIPIQEQNKKRLQEIKEKSRLDLQEIENHQKQYLQRKKSQQKETLQRSNVTHHSYKAPQHTWKIKKILAEQEKQKHKIQIQKKLLLQKIQRVSNYTDQIRKRNLPSRTITTQRQSYEKQSSEFQNKNKKQPGNQYLQQARRQLRRRAKTQEGHNNFIDKQQKKQRKIVVSKTIQLEHREKNILKSKKEQIQRILSFGNCSPQQKLKRIRTADQKLSLQLKKKENKLKRLPMNKKDDQSVLDLMLGTIKAKLNLLNFYQTVQ